MPPSITKNVLAWIGFRKTSVIWNRARAPSPVTLQPYEAYTRFEVMPTQP